MRGTRLPVAPAILALLLAEVLAEPVEEFVSLLADAPYVQLFSSPGRLVGGILDSSGIEGRR